MEYGSVIHAMLCRMINGVIFVTQCSLTRRKQNQVITTSERFMMKLLESDGIAGAQLSVMVVTAWRLMATQSLVWVLTPGC